MTFHRYDPETCGGRRERRTVLLAVCAGFLIGAGAATLATVWAGRGALHPTRASVETAAAVAAPPTQIHRVEFIREPAPRR